MARRRAAARCGHAKETHDETLLPPCLGPDNAYLFGSAITIADYYASSFVALAELLGGDYAAYPNVQRWLKRMKALPSWAKVNEAIDGYGATLDRSAMQCV